MFGAAMLLLKGGRLVARDGEIAEPDPWGATHVVRPGLDGGIETRLASYFDDYRDMRLGSFKVGDGEIEDGGRGRVVVQDCRR